MNAPPNTSPPRADGWLLRRRRLAFGRRPLVMGILNVTPDSFSDGGTYLDRAAAIDHGLQLAAEGAEIIDVGGQSTRPGSTPVDLAEELRRVMPVVEVLTQCSGLCVSIDTSKAAVAREALAAGAEIVNDVTAARGDAEMAAAIAEAGAAVCLMHVQGTPQTMQDNPQYENVLEEVMALLAARRDALEAAGVDRRRIAVDPGIGFGKTLEHNLTLLRGAGRLLALGCPVLVGHSRKRFLSGLLGPTADVLAGTIGVALALARQGVQVLRVHDVAAVRQALVAFEAAGGLESDG